MSEKARDWRGHIDVTDIDPRLLIQTAYMGSRPQGLGFLHHKPGGLSEDELSAIMERSENAASDYNRGSIHIDYLNGRSMKFNVRFDRKTGRRYIDLDWYDHGRSATEHLLREVGLSDVDKAIAKAAAEKEELKREWRAEQEAGAKVAVSFLVEQGGQASSSHPAITAWLKEVGEGPSYHLQRGLDAARELGLIQWRDGEYALTDAGRSYASGLKQSGSADEESALRSL